MICAVLIAAPAFAGTEVGDYTGLPADLAGAATAYDLAQLKVDRQELQRWLADDYTLVTADGKRETKAQSIADSLAPDRKTTYVALSAPVFKVWPAGAALGGVVDFKGTDHGKPFAGHAHFVDVWAKRNGRWQVVFTQVTKAP